MKRNERQDAKNAKVGNAKKYLNCQIVFSLLSYLGVLGVLAFTTWVKMSKDVGNGEARALLTLM